MADNSPARRIFFARPGADKGTGETQVSYFMTMIKNQLGVILRSVLLLSTIMILLQSLDPSRLPISMIQSPSYLNPHPIYSPVSPRAHPFCPIPFCARKTRSEQCPCHLVRGGFTTQYVIALADDRHCQGQTESDRVAYRFIKYEKKRLKRTIKRLLRSK